MSAWWHNSTFKGLAQSRGIGFEMRRTLPNATNTNFPTTTWMDLSLQAEKWGEIWGKSICMSDESRILKPGGALCGCVFKQVCICDVSMCAYGTLHTSAKCSPATFTQMRQINPRGFSRVPWLQASNGNQRHDDALAWTNGVGIVDQFRQNWHRVATYPAGFSHPARGSGATGWSAIPLTDAYNCSTKLESLVGKLPHQHRFASLPSPWLPCAIQSVTATLQVCVTTCTRVCTCVHVCVHLRVQPVHMYVHLYAHMCVFTCTLFRVIYGAIYDLKREHVHI